MFGVLVWVEASSFLRNVLGLRIGPTTATAFHVICRVMVTVAGDHYWFIAVCVMKVLFSTPLALA